MSSSDALKPPRLYVLADLEILGENQLPTAIRAMADAGVPWVQLRLKGASGAQAAHLTEAALEAIQGRETALWIDDRVDVAACFDLLGVHVGQRDLSAEAARRVIGPRMRIGVSTHDTAQIEAADADPNADIIAIGPVFETRSKRDPDPVVGLDWVRRARGMTTKPLVAIGGITAERAPSVLDAGADTVAVLGDCCRGDVASNAKRLVAAVAV